MALSLLKTPAAALSFRQMRTETILVVDNDPELVGLMCATFSLRGLQVVGVDTGPEALHYVRSHARQSQFPCLALIDLNLAGQDGFMLGKELLAMLPYLSLIFLASCARVEDKVYAMLLGADDYITKPFQWAELVARVERNLRRLYEPRMAYFHCGEMLIDLVRGRVLVCGEDVPLSMHEYRFLCCLAQAQGRVVSCTELASYLWPNGIGVTDEEAVRKVKLRVESKLGRVLQKTKVIHNVPRIGYYLEWKSYD
jgi:DNA-binding response OmpR family regulator